VRFQSWLARRFDRRLASAFAYLVSDYGFERVSIDPVMPTVRYENESTWVEFWRDPLGGGALVVDLRPLDTDLAPGVPTIPLWAVLEARRPGPKPTGSPFLRGQIREAASGLAEFASDLLAGNFSSHEEFGRLIALNRANS